MIHRTRTAGSTCTDCATKLRKGALLYTHMHKRCLNRRSTGARIAATQDS
jgi:hypothetical protein